MGKGILMCPYLFADRFRFPSSAVQCSAVQCSNAYHGLPRPACICICICICACACQGKGEEAARVVAATGLVMEGLHVHEKLDWHAKKA